MRLERIGDRCYLPSGEEVPLTPDPEPGRFARELAEACEAELSGARPEPVLCDSCNRPGCAGWCRRHPGHVEAGDRE